MSIRSMMVRTLIAAALAGPGTSAFAGVLTGQSRGFGIQSTLQFEPIAGVNVSASLGPVGQAGGSAPAAYNQSTTVASLNANVGGLNLLGGLVGGNVLTASTGVIQSDAISNVDGLAGPKSTSGSNTIDNLNLGALGLSGLVNFNLLGLKATTLSSNSSVTGGHGSLTASGAVLIQGLQLSVLGLGVNIGVSGSIAANTAVNVGGLLTGLTVVLNEQIVTGDGIASRGITTNAVHLAFNNVLVTTSLGNIGRLNGDIIIGQSFAAMTAQADPAPPASNAVPEPSTFALVGIAGLVSAAYRWKNRARVA